MTKTLRKYLITLLVICLAITSIYTCGVAQKEIEAYAEEEESNYINYISSDSLLSQMTEDECVTFVKNKGIEIPEDFAHSADLGKIIKEIFIQIENNPNQDFNYNYYVTQLFATDIKKAVYDYYGLDSSIETCSTSSVSSYTLQDSTLYSNSGYLNYNCYAYAIDRDEQQSEYKTGRQYQPGDISQTEFNMSLSIYNMALVVKADLQALGYQQIAVSSVMPTIDGNKHLICIRRGTSDYHFMEYISGDWYHKPGFNAILKYNYQPSTSRIWTGEYVDKNGVAHSSSYTYTDTIYYISYQYPSNVSATWSGTVIKTNAVCLSCIKSNYPNSVLRLSTTGIFVPQSSGSLWYTERQIVYMPLDTTGYPYYKYAAVYSRRGSQQTQAIALSTAYNLSTFSTTVTQSTSSYIPISYDQDGINIWNHNGGSKDTIIGTIVYKGWYYDFEVGIPWLGYSSTTVTAIDGVVFSIRTGPNKVSVKANQEVSLSKTSAFAFRLK